MATMETERSGRITSSPGTGHPVGAKPTRRRTIRSPVRASVNHADRAEMRVFVLGDRPVTGRFSCMHFARRGSGVFAAIYSGRARPGSVAATRFPECPAAQTIAGFDPRPGLAQKSAYQGPTFQGPTPGSSPIEPFSCRTPKDSAGRRKIAGRRTGPGNHNAFW